ncbi:MAG: ABC transporter ATP-binding protein [Clostridia bacterium]
MIKLNNISKTYIIDKNNKVNALQNINLEFNSCGLVFISGKSGCGKSTLLHILGTLDKPTNGEFIINGVTTNKFTENAFDNYRKNIGFVFQEFNLIDNINVYNNLAYIYKIKNQSINKEKINDILEKVGLINCQNKKINALSGGEKQRIAIARAIINESKLILADEPTGHLDEKTSKDILQLLKKISQNALVIIVSHNKEDAINYGDRIIKLEDGKIVSDDIKSNNCDLNFNIPQIKKNKKYNFFNFNIIFANIKNKIFLFIINILLLSITFTIASITISFITADINKYYAKTLNDNNINEITVNNESGINSDAINYVEENCKFVKKAYQFSDGNNYEQLNENDLEIYNYSLIEGNLPKNNKEIAISLYQNTELKMELGDKINENTIVGIIDTNISKPNSYTPSYNTPFYVSESYYDYLYDKISVITNIFTYSSGMPSSQNIHLNNIANNDLKIYKLNEEKELQYNDIIISKTLFIQLSCKINSEELFFSDYLISNEDLLEYFSDINLNIKVNFNTGNVYDSKIAENYNVVGFFINDSENHYSVIFPETRINEARVSQHKLISMQFIIGDDIKENTQIFTTLKNKYGLSPDNYQLNIYNSIYTLKNQEFLPFLITFIILYVLSLCFLIIYILDNNIEYKKQVGILYSLGINYKNISFISILEIIFTSLISIILSVASSYITKEILKNNSYGEFVFFNINIFGIIGIILFNIIIILVSYLIIYLKNKKFNPIEIIKNL